MKVTGVPLIDKTINGSKYKEQAKGYEIRTPLIIHVLGCSGLGLKVFGIAALLEGDINMFKILITLGICFVLIAILSELEFIRRLLKETNKQEE